MSDKIFDVLVRLAAEAHVEEAKQMNTAIEQGNVLIDRQKNLTNELTAAISRQTQARIEANQAKLVQEENAEIGRLIERLKELQVRKDNAFDPKSIKAVNAEIAETNRLIEETKQKYAQQTGIIGELLRKRQALQAGLINARSLDEIEELNKAIQKVNLELNNLSALGRKTDLQPLVNGLNKAKGSSDSASFALLNLSRIVQDAPYGFMGMANNINPAFEALQRLNKEAKATGTTMSKELARSLIGAGGIGFAISVVTSLMVTFGSRLFDSNRAVREAKKEVDEFTKSLKQFADTVSREIAAFEKLTRAANNANAPYSERLKAVSALQEQYPQYFANLEKEAILNGKVADSYGKTIEAIIRRARITQLTSDLEGQIARRTELEQKLSDFSTGKAISYPTYDKVLGWQDPKKEVEASLEAVNAQIQRTQATIDAFTSDVPDGIYGALLYGQTKQKPQGRTIADIEQELGAISKEIQAVAIGSEKYYELLRRQKDLQRELDTARGKESTKTEKRLRWKIGLPEKPELESMAHDVELARKFAEFMGKIYGDPLTSGAITFRPIEPLPDAEAEQLFNQIRDQIIRNNIRLEKLREQLRKARHQKQLTEEEKLQIEIVSAEVEYYTRQLEYYNNIVQTAGHSAMTVLQIELEKNQRLIELQQDRVDRAKEIADKGGAEVLQAEEERLQKLEERQRKHLQTQKAINAAMVASQSAVNVANAVGAVVNAAKSGSEQGGYIGLIIAIVGAVAALAAGIASTVNAVSSVNTSDTSVGYYKGGYTGDGDPRETAGPVHKQEFVFDHKSTKQIGVENLERLRYGKLMLVDPASNSIVFTGVDYDGMQRDYNYVRQNYYSNTTDTSRLEQKVDVMTEALKNMGVQFNLDSEGFSASVWGFINQRQKMKNL